MEEDFLLSSVSSLGRDVVFILLSNQPLSGVEIKDEIGSVYGFKPSDTRIYSTLANLEDDGFISCRQSDGRTNNYSLTQRGVKSANQYEKFIEEI